MPQTHLDHQEYLDAHNAVITEWSMYTTNVRVLPSVRDPNPVCLPALYAAGFFTPFTEQNMGLTRSIKGLILMPLLKLKATAVDLLEAAKYLFNATYKGITGEFRDSKTCFIQGASAFYDAVLSFCSFLLETVKSILSIVTRSFATLMTPILTAMRSVPFDPNNRPRTDSSDSTESLSPNNPAPSI